MRDAYRKAKAFQIEVNWWKQDHQPAETFAVSAPFFPLFHPKDSPLIVALVGTKDTNSYSYWTGSRWIRTDGPVNVKLNVSLNLRSLDVTFCLDGPDTSSTSPPYKRKLSFSESSDAQDSPHPGKIRWAEIETSAQAQSSKVKPEDSDFGDVFSSTNSRTKKSRTSVDKTKSTLVSRSQKVFIEHPGSSLISDDEDDAADTLLIPSTLTARRGNASPEKAWPLQYACDMQQGFQAMAQATGTANLRFRSAFQTKFVSATYYQHRKYWSELTPSNQLEVVTAGRTPAGEWSYIMKKYGKAKHHIYLPRGTMVTLALILMDTRSSPSSIKDAIQLLVEANICVDWDFIAGKEVDPTRSLDNQVREWVSSGVMTLPALPESSLTTPPHSQSTERDLAPESDDRGKDPHSRALRNLVFPGDQDKKPEDVPKKPEDAPKKPEDAPKKPEDTPKKPKTHILCTWSGPLADLDDSMFKEFIDFDPKIETAGDHPKLIVLNHLTDHCGLVELIRYPNLFFKFEVLEPTMVDEITISAGTVSAYTRSVVSAWARRIKGLPDENFAVYWRLPGYPNFDEIGPVLINDENDDGNRSASWMVDRDHQIPVLGPPYAGRVLLVIRKLSGPEKSDIMIYSGMYESNHLSLTHLSQSNLTRFRRMSNLSLALPPAPLLPPTSVYPPDTATRTQIKNNGVESWLMGEYGLVLIITQVRETTLRDQQTLGTLLDWIEAIHTVRTSHVRVPESVANEAAAGQIIHNQNIGKLFGRTGTWIKQCLDIKSMMISKKRNPQVIKYLSNRELETGIGPMHKKMTAFKKE
ncbi:hypothetical protein B0H10DRAFT_1945559 [Mycena sp. CBHHK59/15]|nr:hypothetical protein B0H10DRAFT_1945559 [Mycena sp. CBHHK59/15]